MSSAQERLDRFDRATSRLMQAHQDALEACEGALDITQAPTPLDTPEASTPLDTFALPRGAASSSGSEEGRLYRVALEDVRKILLSASEDLRTILGEGDEGGG
jgi:hypothetical protein